MRNLGIGIVGLGYVGNIHLRHCLKMPNAHVAAVSDLSRKALTRAKNVGVEKTFTDFEELLRYRDVDCVIIAVPTHLHMQCAKLAAEARKHIFIEKPLARNVKEGKEILSAARKNSVQLMVGYPLRFNASLCSLREKIKSGILGEVETAYATYVSSGPFKHRAEAHAPIPVPEWWFKKELTGGGALIDLGSHIMNLLRWYFGEITDIKSLLRYRFNMDFEDEAICLAEFESGNRAVINVGWFSQEYRLKIELLGTVKHVSVENRPGNRLSTAIQTLTTNTYQFHRAHLAELQHFVTCLTNDLSPSPSGEDGLKDLEAISLAYGNEIHLEKSIPLGCQ